MNDSQKPPFQTLERHRPPPLPTTQRELIDGKLTKVGRTLNDEVDDIHVILWADDKYREYHEAVWQEEAVEGSTVADNFEAAAMIREFATKDEESRLRYPRVARAKKATIVKALGYVTTRYGQNRNQRRRMIHGEVMPNNGNEE